MNRAELSALVETLFREYPGNVVTAAQASDHSEMISLRMYDAPLFSVAAADDSIFQSYRNADVIGLWHMTPEEWLPGAKSVVSLFFPLSERVRVSNRRDAREPSIEWLFARIEGQEYLGNFMTELARRLAEAGVKCCVPARDPRFGVARGGSGSLIGRPGVTNETYASNWSERHAAYAAGLGTFSLTRGLITKRGMAGRFGSVIIDASLTPDVRPYSDPFEYCIRCGVCVRRCPVGAISLAEGKKQPPCAALLNSQKIRYAPRYGCGKCQTAGPCEFTIPRRA